MKSEKESRNRRYIHIGTSSHLFLKLHPRIAEVLCLYRTSAGELLSWLHPRAMRVQERLEETCNGGGNQGSHLVIRLYSYKVKKQHTYSVNSLVKKGGKIGPKEQSCQGQYQRVTNKTEDMIAHMLEKKPYHS